MDNFKLSGIPIGNTIAAQRAGFQPGKPLPEGGKSFHPEGIALGIEIRSRYLAPKGQITSTRSNASGKKTPKPSAPCKGNS